MDIEPQLQQLLHNAPQDGKTPQLLTQAVIPVLRAYARQMKYPNYYVVQNQQKRWVLTTLSNRAEPDLEKKVVYAFASPQDAMTFNGRAEADLRPVSLPVTHIFFQLFALKTVDSLVFFEKSGEFTAGKEIKRTELENLVQQQFLKTKPSPPADFA